MTVAPHRHDAGGTGSIAPGRRLAEAREAQNLTAADVARQLKLSVWQVEALEGGQFERLPGAIFVRGFIRNYARLVRLDAGELLESAGESLHHASPPPDRPRSRDIPFPGQERPRWLSRALALLFIIGALAGYEIYWNRGPSGAPEVAAGPAATTPAQAPVAAASTEPTEPAGTAAAAPLVATALPSEADFSGPAESPATEQPPAPAPGEKRVHLEFEDESWVEIRDRNEKVIFSQLNRPGTERTIDGIPPFAVVVGNAQAVRMTFDGRPVDLAPHTRIDVARLVLK